MRTRKDLDESTQCPRCAGSGITEHPIRSYGATRCGFCSGSGLTKPPKFQAECECGEKQPRWTTAFTSEQWMKRHLHSHAPEDDPDPDLVEGL